jgi:hypothetical protein
MIESLIVEWFDAEGWLKTASLPTGTSGMVQGADGWEYPKPAPRPSPPKPPCYIAGKFRGPSHWDIAQNIRRAEAVALAAWRSGLFSWVYCPHLNTAHFQDAAPDDVWIEGHLEAMRAVHREGGVVVVMNGWDKSSGTRAELEEAHRIGMPVFRYQGDDTDQIAGVRCARRMNRLLTIGGVGLWDFTNDEATLSTYLTERADPGV